jgi:N-acetylmuramoyl-L-alanine amidase
MLTLRKSRVIILICALTSSLAFSNDTFSAGDQNSIREIRYSSNDAFTRIIIECEKEIVFSQNLLKFPDRLYFDLKETLPSVFNQQEIKVNDGAVESIRIGRYDTGISRVVIGLKSYSDFNVYTYENPYRLVIDINNDVSNGQSMQANEPVIPRKRVVVIDPGHGGHDPGATGRRGLKEKDVVLGIAKELKQILESKYAVKVFLTREDDRYLELKERTDFANNRQADLFVSIHANASPDRKTKGIETWFLNFPDNDYAKRVAARENYISEEKMKKSQTELGFVLVDLARNLKRDESLRLAHYIQNSLVRNLSVRYKNRIEDHGVKYTLFYVLVDADMPAALVETGFITNPDEEMLLRKDSYRSDLAYSLAKGINSYLSTLPDLPKLAKR